MDEDTIQDLKQFIAATIAQQLTQQTGELREEFSALKDNFAILKQDFVRLEVKVDDLTDFVTDAIDTANESAGKQLKDHERRITKLEHSTAN